MDMLHVDATEISEQVSADIMADDAFDDRSQGEAD